MKTEKPIIFNSEMIGAILDGRKTQTRRQVRGISKDAHINNGVQEFHNGVAWICGESHPKSGCDACANRYKSPYGQVGDRLWVKETWQHDFFLGLTFYKADGDTQCQKWRPSIHMPKKYARIFLEITNVRVERVQDISEEDCYAEGMEPEISEYPIKDEDVKDCFKNLWDSIYGNWNENPFVWVYDFKVLDNGDYNL